MSVPDVQIGNDFIFSYENPGNYVEFPEEFILREGLGLDPNDLGRAADIYENYGELFGPNLQELPTPDTPELAVKARRIELERNIKLPRLGVSENQFFTALEIELHFKAMHFLAETWIAMKTPGGLEALAEREFTSEYIGAKRKEIEEDLEISYVDFMGKLAASEEEVMLYIFWHERRDRFVDLLDVALSKFHVGVDLPQERSVSVYAVACLQLYNLMVNKVPVRVCANETCGRRFSQQIGTAKYGQHRKSGVKYCSNACGKAQNERERRRRKSRQKDDG
ncbi:hypothetical protein ABZ914_10755 [Spirillospora sp. NPDC046719]